MRTFFKFLGIIIFATVIGFSMIVCGDGKSALSGTWFLIEGDDSDLPLKCELLRDGTGFALDQAITWKTENNRLYIIHPFLAMAFDYKISRERLNLSNDKGQKFVYVKELEYKHIQQEEQEEEFRLIAEQEFFDLTDLATSAGILSFMDETFIEIIQKFLEASITLEGVIISEPNGEYGFEKERGKAIIWIDGSPRFKKGKELSNETLYLPLRIQGLRNVTIQAVARVF
jgi:hypothetical protein